MSAYKQFLTSDIIVAPLEVHKDFTFTFFTTSSTIELPGGGKGTVPGPNYFGPPGTGYPGVGLNRFLGYNIDDYFDFNPTIDPLTGNYIITMTGTVSSVILSITPFHTEAATVGSSSFSLNGINILLTGSSGGINLGNRICVPTGSTANATTTNINNHLGASSSLYFNLNNINSSPVTSNIIFSSKTREYINNSYYIISASVTTYFSGGTNDTVSGEYQYQRLIYHSIQELYYSNYQNCQYGDPDNPPILVSGFDSDGDRYIGSSNSQAHYFNYLQTTLSYPRFFPTASGARIGVVTVPNTLFGDYIQPNSFYYSVKDDNNTIYEFRDDGEGNLRLLNSFYGTSSAIVGNIIYTHGVITLTGNSSIYDYMNLFNSGQLVSSQYASAIYGNPPVPQYVYGEYLDFNNLIKAFVSSSNVTCSFSSSYTIYETQYKCTIRENEFNYTLNPSTFTSVVSSFPVTNLGASPCDVTTTNTGTSVSLGVPYDYVNQDYFSPYITTVGLYDEQQNLLAIGKLSQPLPSSPTTDTTILINIDR